LEYNVRLKLAGGAVLVAAVIGVSVLTSTVVASRAYENRAKQAADRSREVSTRGSARQRITSDLGVWSIRVQGEGPKLQDAFESVKGAADKVMGFLIDRGFEPGELEVSAIDTKTHFKRDKDGRETIEPELYVMERSVMVSSAKVALIAKTTGEVTLLLKDGVQVFSARPGYYYTELPDLRIAIVGDAARDARVRAEEIVGKSGTRVGEVRHLYTGPIQVSQPNSTDVNGNGSYDTTTIEKDVFVTVSATFGME
jgi:hypothetical protein